MSYDEVAVLDYYLKILYNIDIKMLVQRNAFMEIIMIQCPKCKGKIHVDQNIEKCFCLYCKAEVVVRGARGQAVNSTSLLIRGFLLLEYSDWQKAEDAFEQAANIEPKNAMIYLGKLLAELKMNKEEELNENYRDLSDYVNYQNAVIFADAELKRRLERYNDRAVHDKNVEDMFDVVKANAARARDEEHWSANNKGRDARKRISIIDIAFVIIILLALIIFIL